MTRTDTERLDWMHRHYARFSSALWRADWPLGHEMVTVQWTWFDLAGTGANEEDIETSATPDFRAAIDKAMTESEMTRAELHARPFFGERDAEPVHA